MKQYSLFKASKETYPYLLDVLKLLLGNNIQVSYPVDCILIKHRVISSDELESTIQSLESDLNTLISYYHIKSYDPEKELQIIENVFPSTTYGHYELKNFIPQIQLPWIKKEVFRFIIAGIGIEDQVILAMADNDMNVSKTASTLFMHRNTLLYKIDRLYELHGFDLKKFYDLYLLVYLLKA